jgi:hypothetical protein
MPDVNSTQVGQTAREVEAAEYLDKFLEESGKYWRNRHRVSKRLWARYMNARLQDKDPNFSNIQLGRSWYICDITDAVIGDNLYARTPFGKISGTGNEDFPGSVAINDMHRVQQNQRNIKNVNADSRLRSIVTGTGVKYIGWEFIKLTYRDKVDKTLNLLDPNNPKQPIEIPTGETEYTEKTEIIDRLAGMEILPWHAFPPPGGISPEKDGCCGFLVKMSRAELENRALTEEFQHTELIDPGSWGHQTTDPEIGDEFDQKLLEKDRKDNQPILDKDNIWLFYWFGFYKDEQGNKKQFWMVKPKYQKLMLRMSLSPYPGVPITRDRYCGTDDQWFGFSFMEIIEQQLKLNEDTFGYLLDAAKRELFRTWFVPEDMDQSAFAPSLPDQIVPIPKELAKEGKGPYTVPLPAQYMPNLQEVMTISKDIIEEIAGLIEFANSADVSQDETATKTDKRWQVLSKRLKKRLQYYEQHGLQEWMEWQTVLNKLFLRDDIFEQVTGWPADKNPFMLVKPIIPMQDFNFTFEGSARAADNPVKAQIIKGMIEMAQGIPPGYDTDGVLKQVNTFALYKKFCRLVLDDEDTDEFLMPAMPMVQPGMAGLGGSGIGPTQPGQLLGTAQNLPSNTAGVGPRQT